jgi:hypothetical protein
MKLHIVFEIDTLPEIGLGDVAAVTQLAGTSFARACAPLGDCKLHRIRAASVDAVGSTLARTVERAVTEESK